MHGPTARRCAAALTLFLLTAAAARAEVVPWYYSSIPTPGEVLASTGGPGKVVFTGLSSGLESGNQKILLANLDAVSSATKDDPAKFNKENYQIALTLFDADSKQTGTLTFSGQLHGKLTSDNADVHNHFTGKKKQSIVLGNHLYTVKIGPFKHPGDPGDKSGTLSARVKITDAPPQVNEVPEPAALSLAAVGLSLLGAGWWWRRRPAASVAVA
jgi:hypothetical protein